MSKVVYPRAAPSVAALPQAATPDQQKRLVAMGQAARAQIGFAPTKEELLKLINDLHAEGCLSDEEHGAIKDVLDRRGHEEMVRCAMYGQVVDQAARPLAEKAAASVAVTHQGERIEVAALSPAATGRESAGFNLPAERSALADRLTPRIGRKNLYVGRDPRRAEWRGSRAARAEDVAGSHRALLDIDRAPGEVDIVWEGRKRSLCEKLAPHDPLSITDTGGGLQVVFRLTPSDDPAEVARRTALLNDAGAAIGSDSVSDATRILRIPYTINIPDKKKRDRGRGIALAKPIVENPGARAHDPDKLAEIIREKGGAQGRQTATRVGTSPPTAASVSGREAKTHSPEEIALAIRALQSVPNPPSGPFDDRDDWVRVAHAFVGAGGKNADTREAWLEWCARWGGDPDEDARAFDTINESRVKADMGTLLKLVHEHAEPEEARAILKLARPMGFTPVSAQKQGARAGRRRADVAFEALKAAGLELWRDEEGNAYVAIPASGGGSACNYPLADKAGRDAVMAMLYRAGVALGTNDMKELLNRLEAGARFDGETKKARLRYAYEGGSVYIDPGWPDGRSITVSMGSWTVVNPDDLQDVGFRFVRTDGMIPMPKPDRAVGRSPFLEQLSAHAPLPETESLGPDDPGVQARAATTTFIGGVIESARGGAAPICNIKGPAGSGKTTFAKRLRGLLDPSTRAITTAPRDPQHVAAICRNMAVPAFDNLSAFSPEISDLFCAISTGATYTGRKLYTDGELVAHTMLRPIILTGIDIPMRSDLADRCLPIQLSTQRRPQDEVRAEEAWKEALPAVFAAYLDMLAEALAKLPDIDLDKAPVPPPRFRAAAALGEAMARASGWPDFLLIEALDAMARDSNTAVVSGEPLVLRIALVLGKHDGSWEATAAEWLAEVSAIPGLNWDARGRLRTPNQFSRELRLLETALIKAGWTIARGKRGQGKDARTRIKITAPAGAIKEAKDAVRFENF